MDSNILQVNIKGVYLIETVSGPTPLVLLEDDNKRMMPIYIGLSEALSINAALNNDMPPRPVTHDLFISLLDRMSAKINKILIDELKEGIYYALLYVSNNGSEFELDARPSDCIALALRCDAPIHVKESVIVDSLITKEELQDALAFDDVIS